MANLINVIKLQGWIRSFVLLKSVGGRIALVFEQLGQFVRFLDENDHSYPPNLLITFMRLLGDCIAISKVNHWNVSDCTGATT